MAERESGDLEVQTLAELDDGTRIQHVKQWFKLPNTGDSEIQWTTLNSKLVIDRPDGESSEIEKDGFRSLWWRKRIIENLVDRVDDFAVTDDSNAVPVNIVNEGKPAVAGYLYAIHSWTYEEIQESLDLSNDTVHQYLIAVANDRW